MRSERRITVIAADTDGAAHELHAGRWYGVRGASVEDLSVPKGHEADAGEKKAGEDQPLPGRAEGSDGDGAPGGRGERSQTGEG